MVVSDAKRLFVVCWMWTQPIADETQAFLHQKKLSVDDVDDCKHTATKVAEKDSYTHVSEADLPLGGSAHSLRNQLVGPGSPRQPLMLSKPASYVARTDGRAVGMTSPERSTPPPPYDYSSRAGGRHVSPFVGNPPSSYRGEVPPSSYRGEVPAATKGGAAAVLASDEKYPLMPVSHSQPSSQASAGNSPLPTRTKVTGLPRYGSPTFPPPTARDANRPAPLSIAASGVQSVPGAVRRPVSFVRALEMSDQLAGSPAGRPRLQQLARGDVLQPTAEEDERTYESSYEIAVWYFVIDVSVCVCVYMVFVQPVWLRNSWANWTVDCGSKAGLQQFSQSATPNNEHNG